MSNLQTCDICNGLFGADPFTVTVRRRGKMVRTEYCSAVCGLKVIAALRLTDDLTSLTIDLIGAYDIAELQHVLKGTK